MSVPIVNWPDVEMQLLPTEDLGLLSFREATTSADGLYVLRIRSNCDVPVKMNNGPRDLYWKDAFRTMVETSLQEAEDMMLSLPYTQIRQQVYRLSSVLEVVRLTSLVRANTGESSSVLVDVDLKNTIAFEHHKYVTGTENFPPKGWEDLSTPYAGNRGSPSRQSRLEMVKTDL